jgi:hypothetical protein
MQGPAGRSAGEMASTFACGRRSGFGTKTKAQKQYGTWATEEIMHAKIERSGI